MHFVWSDLVYRLFLSLDGGVFHLNIYRHLPQLHDDFPAGDAATISSTTKINATNRYIVSFLSIF